MGIQALSRMKKCLRNSVSALLLVALTGLAAGCISWKLNGPDTKRVFLYDNAYVVHFLNQKQISISYYFHMRRNAEGNELYISPYSDGPTQKRLIIVSENGVESRSAPGRIVFLNRAHEFVAWTDDYTKGVEFRGGYRLELPKFALFDIDPSGEYFVIGEKPHSTWLGRVDAPQGRVLISQELLAHRVFFQDGRIKICGSVYNRDTPSSGVEQIPSCFTLRKKANGYEIESQINFPWAGGIIDIDPHSDRYLLEGRSDMFAREYIYDIWTDARRSIGRAKSWGVFLTNDLLTANKTGINKPEKKQTPD